MKIKKMMNMINMKIKTISLAFVSLAMLSVSCNDEFLEIGATGSLAEAQMVTQEGIDGVLIGAYSALNGVFGNRFEAPSHWVTGSVAGGEFNKGTDPGDYSSINPVQRYDYPTTQGDLNSLWRGRYEGVARANKVLSLLAASEGLQPATKTRYEAEARMLRAHFYFDLKKHFNNIPVFDETLAAADLAALKNDGDAWAQIESDLTFAAANLPATQSQLGRVNSWAAKALLAKAHLFQGEFPQAETLFDDVIANGVTPAGEKYALLDDFSQIYNAEFDNHAEAVFDVESAMNTGSTQNANYFDDLNYPYNTGPDGPGNCCGFFQPSFQFANKFRTKDGLPLLDGSYNNAANALKNDYGVNSGDAFTPDAGEVDPRLDHTVGRRGIPYLDWIAHPGKAWIRSQVYAGPYSPKKYVYYKSQEGTYTDASSWTRGYAVMNYTIIRFADVLLMAAEAKIQNGKLADALALVNQVRNRAAKSDHWVKNPDGTNAANYKIAPYASFDSKDDALKKLMMERTLELGGEGHRFFDLVRWGTAKAELDAYLQYESSQGLTTKFGGASFTSGKSEYYAIPQQQIDIVNGGDAGVVYTQNPGY
tara:strand:+ start:101912 stop:103684 length:1773 start_codon:yes stop_codon:yes gene_type:complete